MDTNLQYNYLMQFIKSTISVFVAAAFFLLINGNCFGQDYSSRIKICGNSIDQKSFSKSDVDAILKGKINNWRNGNGVLIILNFSENGNAECVGQQVYNKSVNGVKKFWLGVVFQGRANAPIFAEDNEEVLRLITKNKGAIGVLVDYKGEIPAEFKVKITKSSL